MRSYIQAWPIVNTDAADTQDAMLMRKNKMSAFYILIKVPMAAKIVKTKVMCVLLKQAVGPQWEEGQEGPSMVFRYLYIQQVLELETLQESEWMVNLEEWTET